MLLVMLMHMLLQALQLEIMRSTRGPSSCTCKMPLHALWLMCLP